MMSGRFALVLIFIVALDILYWQLLNPKQTPQRHDASSRGVSSSSQASLQAATHDAFARGAATHAAVTRGPNSGGSVDLGNAGGQILGLTSTSTTQRLPQVVSTDDEAKIPFHIDIPTWATNIDIMIEKKQLGEKFGLYQGKERAVSKSQMDEEIFAYEHFFYQRKEGTFLEMGAWDGVMFTNTHFFERKLGWLGIMIEAKPQEYLRLRENRRGMVTVGAAVCEKPQVVHIASKSGVGGIIEFMKPKHVLQWMPEIFALTKNMTDYSELPKVGCVPLISILNKVGLFHINMFFLDVEGGELSVLKGMDFDKIQVDLFCIESTIYKGSNDDKIEWLRKRKFMREKGFVFYGRVRMNDWYVRKGFEVAYRGADNAQRLLVQGEDPYFTAAPG